MTYDLQLKSAPSGMDEQWTSDFDALTVNTLRGKVTRPAVGAQAVSGEKTIFDQAALRHLDRLMEGNSGYKTIPANPAVLSQELREGTALLEQLSELTGEPVPARLADLSSKPRRFDAVTEKENMTVQVLDLLK